MYLIATFSLRIKTLTLTQEINNINLNISLMRMDIFTDQEVSKTV